MEKALKKLRIKFIATMMGIMAALIIVVFTTICVISYQQELSTVYDVLDRAASSDDGLRRALSLDSNEDSVSGLGYAKRFEFGKRNDEGRLIPVAVYAMTDDGTFYQLESRSPYALSDDILEEAATRVLTADDGNGTLPSLDLVYAKRGYANIAIVAFADDSSVGAWEDLAHTLAIVGLLTLLVFFVISLALSKWALKPVERAWMDQRRFIADASHELKTPLTVISANTAILEKNMDKTIASQSQWVESTEDEVTNMRELVDDLLSIASADEGKIERQIEQVDLSKLVEGQLLQFESLAYENNIDLGSSIAKGIKIEGDRVRLQRLVRTLLDNACKYSGNGASVNVVLEHHSHKAILTVTNTGSVISAEDLPHIFERFYRADKARVRESGGYGLGLAIAHDIAEEHGATLSAASSREEGTAFRVEWTGIN